VTSGYYKSSPSKLAAPKLIIHPDRADDPGVLGDRGGNGLLFGTAKDNNLHALWDVCLVRKAAGATSCSSARPTSVQIKAFSTKVASWVKALGAAAFKPTGDHHTWAAAWATDSLHVAATSKAYEFARANGVVHDNHQGELWMSMDLSGAPTKRQYITSHIQIMKDQLSKAGVRLAELLNHIEWK